MMLFLCSHNNVNLFDWLNESSLVEQPFMLKKISSNQLDLSSFAKKEALSINYYKYLAVDLSAVTNDSDNFKIALQSIQMVNPKIKFLYIDIGNKVQVLQEVIKRLGDIPIISTSPDQDISQFKSEVTSSLQYIPPNKDTEKENMNEAEIETEPKNELKDSIKSNKKEYVFPDKDVMVAVLNCYTKSGATTLSINLAGYLHSIGASVAYVECNGALDHLDNIRSSTSGFTAVKENRYDRNGVIYLKSELPEGLDFVINDMSGTIQDGTEVDALEFISKCNIVILCGTSKPYELQEVKNKIQLLEKNNCKKICLCLAFAPDHEKAHLVDMFGTKNVNVYFTGYTPDMFKNNVNNEMFKRICQDHIQEKINDKMLKLF